MIVKELKEYLETVDPELELFIDCLSCGTRANMYTAQVKWKSPVNPTKVLTILTEHR